MSKENEIGTCGIPEGIAKPPPQPSPYHMRNPGTYWLDYYEVWDMIMEGKPHQVGDSALGHAFKKFLAPGKRSGGKDRLHDLKDIRWSVDRAIQQVEERIKNGTY